MRKHLDLDHLAHNDSTNDVMKLFPALCFLIVVAVVVSGQEVKQSITLVFLAN